VNRLAAPTSEAPEGLPTVLVTGGTRGIGAAIARRFAEGNWRVLVTARSQGSFDDFISDLAPSLVGRVGFLPVDFLDQESMMACEAAVAGMDRLDALVNNAGENVNNPLPDIRIEDVERLYRVNLESAIRLMKVAAGVMRRGGRGRIVNISSIWSVVSREGRLAYSASKAGLVGATRAAAVDLAPYNILVNAVSPGFTMTELTARTLSESDVRDLEARIPMRRFARPDEMSGAVYFLCSEENSYTTGQNIVIDGGYTVV
jgi:3-oxoacyl-[acyl-carrier protein] reductase